MSPSAGLDLLTGEEIAAVHEALGGETELHRWALDCHSASAAIVQRGDLDVLGPMRVARGSCRGVPGQHSWVVRGLDCYAESATIIDPTLWSYDDEVTGLWVGTRWDERHTPHGAGMIWEWGKPENAECEADRVVLAPRAPLSKAAQDFLDLLGPLDKMGWGILASRAPVEGWPAGEILAAITDTPGLEALVPIDRIGMLTNRNPGGVYLRGDGDA